MDELTDLWTKADARPYRGQPETIPLCGTSHRLGIMLCRLLGECRLPG